MDLTTTLATFLLHATWMTALLAALATAAERLAGLSPTSRYRLWGVALVFTIVLPSFRASSSSLPLASVTESA